jgi:hypothetical protein
MNPASFIDDALRDPLAVARSQRAIGYVGTDVPVELILASGARPIRLRGVSAAPTTHADRFVEASFSGPTRHIAEQWLAGELDALAAVIFSRSDDSAQRLYYYLCELQRTGQCGGPQPLLYDVARIQRSSSLAHTLASTRELATQIGAQSVRLPGAIAQVQRRRTLQARLAGQRAAARIHGSLSYRAVRAADVCWTAEFDDRFEQWLDTLEPIAIGRRLVLIGSEPVDERLHDAVEAAGATVVAEINEAVAPELPAFARDDPFAAVGTHAHRRIHAARTLLSGSDLLTARVRALRADGAILWCTASDTGLAWEVPRIEQAVRDAGCAVLKLVLQEADVDATTLGSVTSFTLEAQ